MTTAHEDRAHSLLSASRLPRLLRCPGSVALEEQFPDDETWDAADGTASHELAAKVLGEDVLVKGRVTTPGDAMNHLGEKIKVGQWTFEVDEERAEYVNTYCNLVRSLVDEEGGGFIFKLEQAVDYSNYIGVPNQKGLSDCIILNPGRKELIAIDLKYGRGVHVSAEGNEQGRGYLLGALNEVAFAEIETVKSVIAQVRVAGGITEETLTVDELEAWARKVLKPNGAMAAALHKEFAAGRMTTSDLDASGYLAPGEKQCKFCRAAKHLACPAFDRAGLAPPTGAVTADDFEDLTAQPSLAKEVAARAPLVAELDNEALAQRFLAVELVENWCKNVRAEIERRLTEGQVVPDPSGGELKLVRGRAGNRAWGDKDAAEAALKGLRLKVDEMYDRKVISPTKAEKILKGQPKKWAKLQDLITRSEGSLSVARASDERPAVVLQVQETDFEVITDQPETQEDLSSLV